MQVARCIIDSSSTVLDSDYRAEVRRFGTAKYIEATG